MYKLRYSAKSVKQLKKLDPFARKMILNWLDKNINGCYDPHAHGKALTENLHGWRYRVGIYRIIADICQNSVTVLVLNVEKRDKIYK
jgi:mRNA interferase RelE/StbE